MKQILAGIDWNSINWKQVAKALFAGIIAANGVMKIIPIDYINETAAIAALFGLSLMDSVIEKPKPTPTPSSSFQIPNSGF